MLAKRKTSPNDRACATNGVSRRPLTYVPLALPRSSNSQPRSPRIKRACCLETSAKGNSMSSPRRRPITRSPSRGSTCTTRSREATAASRLLARMRRRRDRLFTGAGQPNRIRNCRRRRYRTGWASPPQSARAKARSARPRARLPVGAAAGTGAGPASIPCCLSAAR
jgi:hypothetical protein